MNIGTGSPCPAPNPAPHPPLLVVPPVTPVAPGEPPYRSPFDCVNWLQVNDSLAPF